MYPVPAMARGGLGGESVSGSAYTGPQKRRRDVDLHRSERYPAKGVIPMEVGPFAVQAVDLPASASGEGEFVLRRYQHREEEDFCVDLMKQEGWREGETIYALSLSTPERPTQAPPPSKGLSPDIEVAVFDDPVQPPAAYDRIVKESEEEAIEYLQEQLLEYERRR